MPLVEQELLTLLEHPGACFYSIFNFMCMFCRLLFVLFLLTISFVLSVLLRVTNSDYFFGIFTLFYQTLGLWNAWSCCCFCLSLSLCWYTIFHIDIEQILHNNISYFFFFQNLHITMTSFKIVYNQSWLKLALPKK